MGNRKVWWLVVAWHGRVGGWRERNIIHMSATQLLVKNITLNSTKLARPAGGGGKMCYCTRVYVT